MKAVALTLAEWSIIALMAVLILLPWTDLAAPKLAAKIEAVRTWRGE